jgi:hypothetical protein
VVSLKYVSPYSEPERLLQSVDTAIRRKLLEDDPLSLAAYLWVAETHKPPLTNRDRLVAWGYSWIREVFVEQNISRRRDEEIASASLAIIALIQQSQFQTDCEQVRLGFAGLLNEELSSAPIPFRQASYAAFFLLAAQLLGIEHPRLREAAKATSAAFRKSLPGGRLFGVSFCSRLLREVGETQTLDELGKSLQQVIRDPQLGYEDRIYGIQAVHQIYGDAELDEETIHMIDEVVSTSPIYMYLMVGMEDIPPVSDDHTAVKVSHLYRAALFDVAIQNRDRAQKQEEQQKMALYRGRKWIGWSVVLFYALLFLSALAALFYKFRPHMGNSVRFWMRGDETAMPFSFALIVAGEIVLFAYLLHIGIVTISTLHSALVRLNVHSDQWVREQLLPRLWSITKRWAFGVSMSILLGVLVNIISPRFESGLKLKR